MDLLPTVTIDKPFNQPQPCPNTHTQYFKNYLYKVIFSYDNSVSMKHTIYY